MYLSRRSKGVYYLWYEDDLGRKHKVSTRTTLKSEAIQFLRKFDPEALVEEKSKRLSDFTAEFLAFAGTTYSAKTNEMYERILRVFREHTGDMLLSKITAQQVDAYKAARLCKVKAVSVNIEIRTLRAAFSTAKRWKLITENPCSDVTSVAVPEAAPIFLTTSDFEKLLSVIREDWFKELVVFAVLTGLRRGERCNLHWQDVDLKNRVIHIRSAGTFKTIFGKRRTVALNTTALSILQSRQHHSQSEYVFTVRDKRIRDDYVCRLFKRYVRRAKLSDIRLHFHSVRHTCASWCIQNGASLYEVQRLLGHSVYCQRTPVTVPSKNCHKSVLYLIVCRRRIVMFVAPTIPL
jgi:integrase